MSIITQYTKEIPTKSNGWQKKPVNVTKVMLFDTLFTKEPNANVLFEKLYRLINVMNFFGIQSQSVIFCMPAKLTTHKKL